MPTQRGNHQKIELTQSTTRFDAPIEGSQTKILRQPGFRGLAIYVPSGWTAADIAFKAIDGPRQDWLRDELGDPVVITGIQTTQSGLYISPPALWALGAVDAFRIASVGVGALTPVTQTDVELYLHFLR
jgi:hypothetical protein